MQYQGLRAQIAFSVLFQIPVHPKDLFEYRQRCTMRLGLLQRDAHILDIVLDIDVYKRQERDWEPLCMLEMTLEHVTGKQASELAKQHEAQQEIGVPDGGDHR